MPTITADGKAKLDTILKENVSAKEIPGATFAVATASGDPIYMQCEGEQVLGEPAKGKVDEDTVLQLMSMTKLIVSIAAVQLVEKGLVTLDDPAVIEKNLPELAKLEVLTEMKDGKPVFAKRTKPITLRMLLTHTNGTGYDVMAPLLGEWAAATGNSGAVFGKNLSIKSFEQPLLFQPGEGWNYSLGLDWAGILIERITGQTLDEYFKEHIFGPVGALTLTFIPTPQHYDHLQAPTTRDENGKLFVFPGIRDTAPESIKGQMSGGAGLYGTARDYLRVLQGLLLALQKPGGIISPESAKLFFSNQLPKGNEDVFREGQNAFARMVPHISPQLIDGGDLTHSLGGFVCKKDSPHGRHAYSQWWEGIYKTFYWIDPDTGIAGVFTTQLYAFAVPGEKFDLVFNKLERALYDNLQK